MGMQSELLQERYRIMRPLGRGGFGAVYLAADTRLGRRVAIKEVCAAQLPPDEQEIAARLFEREALMLAQLDHPNLVRVWDYFQQDGRAFLVMEYIDGSTLRDLLIAQRGPLPEALVIECGRQLCAVLTYLHTRQPPVIFRDLKPANVMLLGAPQGLQSDDGELCFKLIDFGIARLFKPEQSNDTLVIGTPGYAPPEQYGQGQTDERSDVYSLGATLHHLLSGRPPQVGALPPLADLAPNVSPALARVVDQATALDSTVRYPSAEAMHRDLVAIARTSASLPQTHVSTQPDTGIRRAAPITSRPRVPLAPPGAPVRPRQTPSFVLAILIVAVLGVLALAGIALRSVLERPGGQALTVTSIAQTPTGVVAGALPVPTVGSQVDWLLPDATGRIAFGQSTNESLTYDLMIATLDGQPPQQLTRDGASISPAWSSDGRLAFASLSGRERQGILAGNLEGRRFNPVGPTDVYARYPAWSPDSSKLAYGSGPNKNGPFKLAIIDLDSGVITYPGPERVAWISWSRQGSVAYGARQRSDTAQDIFVLDENNTPHNLTNSAREEEDFPDWSPDGRKLVFVSSPAGSQNLVQRQIYTMNADGSERTQITRGPGPNTNPVWSPDGSWIAYLSKAGGNTWQVWAMRADGSQPRQLTFGSEQKFYLAWGR